MAFIYREWRIVAASLFALVAIGGAYALATGTGAPRLAEASTETALLSQIAGRDSTGDGLPDWQKALYGIPLTATTTDYFNLGMTDGEAVAKGLIVPLATIPGGTSAATSNGGTAASFGLVSPSQGSLTDVFAQNFFTLYISATQNSNDGTLTSDQIDTLSSQALSQLSGSIAPTPDFKTAADIRVIGSGPDSMKTYAANAEVVINKYDPHLPQSDLSYLQDYLDNNTASDLDNLAKIALFYQQVATGLAATAVPSELAAVQLALVNKLARTGWEITDFSHTDADPLSAMLALQQHTQTVLDLQQAFSTLETTYAAAGVAMPAGTPGASFVHLTSTTASATP